MKTMKKFFAGMAALASVSLFLAGCPATAAEDGPPGEVGKAGSNAGSGNSYVAGLQAQIDYAVLTGGEIIWTNIVIADDGFLDLKTAAVNLVGPFKTAAGGKTVIKADRATVRFEAEDSAPGKVELKSAYDVLLVSQSQKDGDFSDPDKVIGPAAVVKALTGAAAPDVIAVPDLDLTDETVPAGVTVYVWETLAATPDATAPLGTVKAIGAVELEAEDTAGPFALGALDLAGADTVTLKGTQTVFDVTVNTALGYGAAIVMAAGQTLKLSGVAVIRADIAQGALELTGAVTHAEIDGGADIVFSGAPVFAGPGSAITGAAVTFKDDTATAVELALNADVTLENGKKITLNHEAAALKLGAGKSVKVLNDAGTPAVVTLLTADLDNEAALVPAKAGAVLTADGAAGGEKLVLSGQGLTLTGKLAVAADAALEAEDVTLTVGHYSYGDDDNGEGALVVTGTLAVTDTVNDAGKFVTTSNYGVVEAAGIASIPGSLMGYGLISNVSLTDPLTVPTADASLTLPGGVKVAVPSAAAGTKEIIVPANSTLAVKDADGLSGTGTFTIAAYGTLVVEKAVSALAGTVAVSGDFSVKAAVTVTTGTVQILKDGDLIISEEGSLVAGKTAVSGPGKWTASTSGGTTENDAGVSITGSAAGAAFTLKKGTSDNQTSATLTLSGIDGEEDLTVTQASGAGSALTFAAVTVGATALVLEGAATNAAGVTGTGGVDVNGVTVGGTGSGGAWTAGTDSVTVATTTRGAHVTGALTGSTAASIAVATEKELLLGADVNGGATGSLSLAANGKLAGTGKLTLGSFTEITGGTGGWTAETGPVSVTGATAVTTIAATSNGALTAGTGAVITQLAGGSSELAIAATTTVNLGNNAGAALGKIVLKQAATNPAKVSLAASTSVILFNGGSAGTALSEAAGLFVTGSAANNKLLCSAISDSSGVAIYPGTAADAAKLYKITGGSSSSSMTATAADTSGTADVELSAASAVTS
jgi:hypothetical protein